MGNTHIAIIFPGTSHEIHGQEEEGRECTTRDRIVHSPQFFEHAPVKETYIQNHLYCNYTFFILNYWTN